MVTHWTSCVSCLYHGSSWGAGMQRSEASGLSKLSVQCDPIFWPIFGYYQLLAMFNFWGTSHDNTKRAVAFRCIGWWPVDSLWTRRTNLLAHLRQWNCQLVAEEEIEEVRKVPYATNQPTRQPGNPPTPKQENRKTGPLVYMSKLQLRDGRDRKCMDQTPESSAQLLSQSVSVA